MGIDTSPDASMEVLRNTLEDTTKEAILHGSAVSSCCVFRGKVPKLPIDASLLRFRLLVFALSAREI